MSADNSEQIAEWNGALGQRWVAMQREINRIVVPFGDAALKAATPQSGERVIDIGCGCGDTSIEIARMVGEAGAVLGIDVSQPMLEVARSRGALANWAHLSFRDGDASEAELPTNTDLLFSRFGVMFFSQPSQAFSHLRKSLRTGGRCVFACWRAPRDNAWAMAPLSAARTAMGVTPTPADPDAPGPFSFADEDRLREALVWHRKALRVAPDCPVVLWDYAQTAGGNTALNIHDKINRIGARRLSRTCFICRRSKPVRWTSPRWT